MQNRFGRVPVRVRPEVFQSDERIVAILGHEMHELNGLRSIMDQRGQISGAELRRLIMEGNPGNLHDQAWDVADDLVARMRSGTK
jgi:hypothetical protein